MEPTLESAINRWHAAVNDGDLTRAEASVSDPIVVLGPKGAGRLHPAHSLIG